MTMLIYFYRLRIIILGVVSIDSTHNNKESFIRIKTEDGETHLLSDVLGENDISIEFLNDDNSKYYKIDELKKNWTIFDNSKAGYFRNQDKKLGRCSMLDEPDIPEYEKERIRTFLKSN